MTTWAEIDLNIHALHSKGGIERDWIVAEEEAARERNTELGGAAVEQGLLARLDVGRGEGIDTVETHS